MEPNDQEILDAAAAVVGIKDVPHEEFLRELNRSLRTLVTEWQGQITIDRVKTALNNQRTNNRPITITDTTVHNSVLTHHSTPYVYLPPQKDEEAEDKPILE